MKTTRLSLGIFVFLAFMVACGGVAPGVPPSGVSPQAGSGTQVGSEVKGEAGGLRINLQSGEAGRSGRWNTDTNQCDFSYQPNVVVTVENTADAERSLISYEFRSALGDTGESHSVAEASVLNPSGEKIASAILRDDSLSPGEVRRYRIELGNYSGIENLKFRVLWVGQPTPLLDTPLKPVFQSETLAVPPPSTPLPTDDFSFTLYQGEEQLGAKTLHLSDLRGKPVVLNFCCLSPERFAIQRLDFQRLHENYNTQVIVIGIDLGSYLSGDGFVNYPVGKADDPSAMSLSGIPATSIPNTVFITSEGEIFRIWNGMLDESKLTELVEEMLANEQCR